MARSLIASDDFNRADGGLGSNWTFLRDIAWQPVGPEIVSNKVRGSAGGAHYQVSRWVGAGSFGNDQYASGVISDLAWQDNSFRGGVVVRASADTDSNADFYGTNVYADGPGTYTTVTFKMVNGTETTLNSQSISWVNGDLIELEVEGTTLRAMRNGTAYYTGTDSALTTGKPGILVGGSFATINAWEGGDIAAADTTAPTLTSPTGTQTGSTTASGTVTTDEANGTLYSLATTNATETAATVKASGTTQTVSSTGSKSVNFTGLTASTTYYAHYVHRDAAGNDSSRVSSSSFTTASSGPAPAIFTHYYGD